MRGESLELDETMLSTGILFALLATQPAGVPQGTVRPPIQRPPTTSQLPGIRPGQLRPLAKPALWGWAELHAHPASHAGFGANDRGEGGIFWGKPGLGLAGANPVADMPPCPADSHYGFDEDVVRKETRKEIIKILDGLTGWAHGPNGGGTFRNWPHAQSLIHQQMHVTSVKRAYDGGCRLMIASVTDSQMLSNLWTKVGFNLLGNSVPPVDPNFDLTSARRQLDYINRIVAANPTWMRIVTSAAEARKAIAENRMAIILSVEMDFLNADQIISLVRNHKVRHVIPIHLTDGPFGGCAVYSDVFNSASNYLNGRFYQVRTDPLLEMRLGRPSVLRPAELGSIKPTEISDAQFAALGYTTGTGGHKNRRGLVAAEFRKLMREGLLLDVAHMGEASTDGAILLGKALKYPLMNSHTGLRKTGERGHSERDLKRSHAQAIAQLGGVVGLGTEGTSSDRILLEAKGSPLIRFTGDNRPLSRPLPTAGGRTGQPISRLRLTIATGGDDLRGGNDNANVRLTLASGRELRFDNINRGQGWGGGVRRTVELPIPAGTRIGDIVSFTLVSTFGGGIGGDNWDVNEVRLVATERQQDTIATWLAEYRDALSVMGGGKVAIGTDINGFAPQVPFASASVTYPLTAAQRFGTPPAGYRPPALARYQAGSKTYDFRVDGIAHFGMLADFIQALSQQPNSQAPLNALFRSANDVVEMWEKAEAAARNIR